MTIVAGASRYLNAAIISNKGGKEASAPASLLSRAGDLGSSLLSAGRSLYGNNGIGMSANARAQTEQFLSQTKSGFNAVFGMSTIKLSSIENLQLTINALRASLPDSDVAESLRGKIVNEEA